MRTLFLSTLIAFVVPLGLQACSFCAANVATRNTLREEYAQGKAVVVGTLKNPKVNPDGISGTTEFHFDTVLKTAGIVENRKSLTIPKYFPVIGNTPPGYLFFFDEQKGEPMVVGGVPSTAAVVKYLTAASKFGDKDVVKRLAFFFDHLDSPDSTVSTDAFLEFAKASDADVIQAKASLDPKRVQQWLTDPKTPSERVGLYAMMLGLCGSKEQARTFAAMLQRSDEAVRANLGGILAGYILLDAKSGWAALRGILADAKQPFESRYAAISAVRYLQAVRPKENRDPVLALYRDLLDHTDFSDLAMEDLRRWGWWDLTADVLAVSGKPIAKTVIIKKAVVRYALTCPDDAAKKYIANLRKSDAALVQSVEEGLKLLK
jgi:hypothetical protein